MVFQMLAASALRSSRVAALLWRLEVAVRRLGWRMR
jgi:hypothetical protein